MGILSPHQSVDPSPDGSLPHSLLGTEDAAEDFDKALSMAEEWGLAWFVRGRYRDGLGDREGANADFLRAYELGHSDPWLIQRVREISG